MGQVGTEAVGCGKPTAFPLSGEDYMELPKMFRDDILAYEVEMPVKEFFYTFDQVAYLLDLDEDVFEKEYVWYQGREHGILPGARIKAINIAPPRLTPNWRIPERELKTWMKRKGIHFYEQRRIKPPRPRKISGQ